MRMYRFSRSSRATGPKMRVPRGARGHQPVRPRGHGADTARAPAFFAGHDPNLLAAVDLYLELHHKTSGASETMRMYRFSRSSRAAGPKMRVPRGFPPSSMMT